MSFVWNTHSITFMLNVSIPLSESSLYRTSKETSEYKSISITKECLASFKEALFKKNSLIIIGKRVYQSIKINGRKCRKQRKKTVFDILEILYEKTV